jgi:hypothetical protein
MLDAISTVILAGMMFIPIINLVVGIIVGTGLFGVAGGFAGAALAVLITIAAFNRGWANRLRQVAATASLIFHRGPERISALASLRPPTKRKCRYGPSFPA